MKKYILIVVLLLVSFKANASEGLITHGLWAFTVLGAAAMLAPKDKSDAAAPPTKEVLFCVEQQTPAKTLGCYNSKKAAYDKLMSLEVEQPELKFTVEEK